MIANESGSVVSGPKFIVPRQIGLTRSAVRPRRRYSMCVLRVAGDPVDATPGPLPYCPRHGHALAVRRLVVIISLCHRGLAWIVVGRSRRASGDRRHRSTATPNSDDDDDGRDRGAPIGHVFVINLENEDYTTTWGATSPARYLNGTLVPKGKLLTQYYGIGHASLDNYIAEISGSRPTRRRRATASSTSSSRRRAPGKYGQALGKGCVYPKSVKTIADQLTAAGKTWRGYMEDMGTPCRHPAIGASDTTIAPKPGDMYATRHEPVRLLPLDHRLARHVRRTSSTSTASQPT